MTERHVKIVIESVPTLTPQAEARYKAIFGERADADWPRLLDLPQWSSAIPERIALGESSYTSRKILGQNAPLLDPTGRRWPQ